MENKDKPAYPSTLGCADGCVYPVQQIDNNLGGLTKREMFAMAAMQGLIAQSQCSVDTIAKNAIAMADELLERLKS
jgi:ATP-dependent protease HslVU (ClpYQ) peptidase subunit